MAFMRAQVAKLSEPVKKKASVEVSATSHGQIASQRRSAKDRLGCPTNEGATTKALVLSHRSP